MQVAFVFFLMTIVRMARKRQISLNVTEDVYHWFTETEVWLDESKTRLGLTGFIVLLAAEPGMVADARTLASLVDRGLINWGDVLDWAKSDQDKRRKLIEYFRVDVGLRDPLAAWLRDASVGAHQGGDEPAEAQAVRKAAASKKPKKRRRQ